MKPFAIVVAFDTQYGIGKDGALAWYSPLDLKHFREITSSKNPEFPNVVIMGRKTWESLPEKFRPLPNRVNVVITHNPSGVYPSGVLRCSSLEEALNSIPTQVGDVFVIGGGQIFKEAIDHRLCTKLFVTHIKSNFDCDTFFPPIGPAFMLVSAGEVQRDGDLSLQFCEYWRH